MRFEEAYSGWRKRRLTQEEAAKTLGVSDRTYRRYVNRYDDNGLVCPHTVERSEHSLPDRQLLR